MNLVDALMLKNIKGVGDDTVLAIMKIMRTNGCSNLKDFAKFGLSDLPIKRIPIALREFLTSDSFEKQRCECKQKIASWMNLGIEVFSYDSAEYPPQLRDLDKPPPFLFCKGDLTLLHQPKAIAVVGTRENTKKGELITRKTVQQFANYGFTIVSGLALGIDSIAHHTALSCGAPTIAVLVDLTVIFPSSNRELAQKILESRGLLVAENSPGTKAIPGFFAKRDRIQAGLSMAVFAIETSIKGGTMNAVKAASSMRRPIFVPDASAAGYPDLGELAISGTQALVQEGDATPYTRDSYELIKSELEKKAKSFSQALQVRRLL